MVTSAEANDPPPDLTGELEVVGRISGSSNLAVLARVLPSAPAAVERPDVHVIYKPVRGEKPLWDFPDGTLAGREVAAAVVSELGGWHLVPPTVLRDGPLGPGSAQLWVGDPYDPLPDDRVVDLVPEGRVPPGWHEVLDGETPGGRSVTVVHSDAPDVRSLAVLDAAINNSDRKGTHCLRDRGGRLWGIDHGVSFSAEPKLRTVLWGWAGERLPAAEIARLERLADELRTAESVTRLGALLPEQDLLALVRRVDRLLRVGEHPHPAPGWPAVPWPPL
jgi:uncharacterized repeat protein (TIGR03843 family)